MDYQWTLRLITNLSNGDKDSTLRLWRGSCRETLYETVRGQRIYRTVKLPKGVDSYGVKISWNRRCTPNVVRIIKKVVERLNEQGFGPVTATFTLATVKFYIPLSASAPVLSSYLGAFPKFLKSRVNKRGEILNSLNQYGLICEYFSTLSAKDVETFLVGKLFNGVYSLTHEFIENNPKDFVKFIQDRDLESLLTKEFTHDFISNVLGFDVKKDSW